MLEIIVELIARDIAAVFTVTEIIVERIAQGKYVLNIVTENHAEKIALKNNVLNIVTENHAVQAVSEIIAHRIAQVDFLQLYSKMATFLLYISCIFEFI